MFRTSENGTESVPVSVFDPTVIIKVAKSLKADPFHSRWNPSFVEI